MSDEIFCGSCGKAVRVETCVCKGKLRMVNRRVPFQCEGCGVWWGRCKGSDCRFCNVCLKRL